MVLADIPRQECAAGVALSQLQPEGERVVAYHSKTFSKAERRYCVTRRELLAVWLMSFREPEGQLARWIEELQAYDFTVVHRPGVQHGNADALSRRPCVADACCYCEKREAQEEELLRQEARCAVVGIDAMLADQGLAAVDAAEWEHKQGEDSDITPVQTWVLEQRRPPL
ncbi:uncharacterized protein LOC142895006 [Nelusetta ayraudi]|uniref:uncharacterized protein LOC142895006 n=1 Tax=Nelusetta ayraudi TaxID=303726 RepID=UPI003F714A9A